MPIRDPAPTVESNHTTTVAFMGTGILVGFVGILLFHHEDFCDLLNRVGHCNCNTRIFLESGQELTDDLGKEPEPAELAGFEIGDPEKDNK